MKIAIASGKGGTGKTTLASNLASYLAESTEVLLADLDVEEPNSGIFISKEPDSIKDNFKKIPEWNSKKCIKCGNCQKVCNFNAVMKLADEVLVFPELCHSCFACSELCPAQALPMKPKKMGETKTVTAGNLKFIESQLLIGEEQAVPLIAQTINEVEYNYSDYEWIFFDSPPGTSCPVIEVLKNVDYVILITEPTPFGLHDLKLAVETVKKVGIEFGVVINRFGIGNSNVVEYCEKEKIDILAKIPNNRKIAELYSNGELLYPKLDSVKNELQKVNDSLTSIKKRRNL